ncbi:hypothetical protein DH2020_022528 [Rehmannia glutinosa]|uniref:Reverse transcriptase domain-containing protein n=1 Tax=Rehmannia glutinosa TaxID=99300 RepID=A0ABR0WDY3_REHGL
MLFKADFEKAYDSIDCKFLMDMMRALGFEEKWCKWIWECISTASASVLVNGSPIEEFKLQRGLRQGDPLSPFLFVFCEGLNLLINKACERNIFEAYSVGKDKVKISHLQFADDTIVLGNATKENVWVVKAILRNFELVSDLKVNFGKSCLFTVNVRHGDATQMAQILNCKMGSLPFIYLGLPIGANPRKRNTWKPVIDTLHRRRNRWENKHLLFGGIIVLIKAVLSSLPIYYLSPMRALKNILKDIERIQRKFLWGGKRDKGCKISWVKWDLVCKAKKEGGLGVRDLDTFNRALLGKWGWRLVNNNNQLWA